MQHLHFEFLLGDEAGNNRNYSINMILLIVFSQICRLYNVNK